MKKIFESTRDKNIEKKASEAILQGLSEEGGLFVMRDLPKCSISIKDMLDCTYQEMAVMVLKELLDDFSEEEIQACVNQAYDERFATKEITPLVKVNDAYVLELFHGATSAFKDVGLSLLPQLMKTSLKKSKQQEDILILTATSGDTGKAALEGFKDVERIKIMVFYPEGGVSAVQKAQMQTQEGNNVSVCALQGNFDDAQSGIKKLFVDEPFKKQLKEANIALSSANSINIGRLVPQMVYYFYAYVKLVKEKVIHVGDEINFVVPTGNFGNVLAGYYAKLMGLPVHRFIVAANENNVLCDFINTGIYDRKRPFLKTISPSMDILISSNLERLLYYASDCDHELVRDLMNQLNNEGRYAISESLLAKIHADFSSGYATNEDTKKMIAKVFKESGYLMDTHTAVAYKVMEETKEEGYVHVVLSTASPFKFTQSVYESLFPVCDLDEFALMEELASKTGVAIPENLKGLHQKTRLHKDVILKEEMQTYILKKVGMWQ